MDALDFAIFRWMSPSGEARFWGTRRLIDPRITPREIAEHVGASENGVRARIRALGKSGFFHGSEVCPNPALFGARLMVAEIPVASAGESRQLLDDLALVEGVTFARDILDESDRKLKVHFVSSNGEGTARLAGLLARLAPGHRIRPAESYWTPPCELEPTPLDWRVVRAFRKAPDDALSRVAQTIGITLKTAGRRFHRLIDARACWWTHSQGSEEFPMAQLTVTPEPGTDSVDLARSVALTAQSWMPVSHDGRGSDPSEPDVRIVGLVPVETPARLERLIDRIAALPDVSGVERTFALGSRSYPDWFDREIERRVEPSRRA
ncbi:MAG: winged helix-turn-helix transcriptional regulator [Thermoplasmata archaeon]|nr:winged helix-turn-helix transcriptional regulator [Thermoplasmata archaeon]